jgi:hypothetical protein
LDLRHFRLDRSVNVRNYEFCRAFVRAAFKNSSKKSSTGIGNNRADTTVWSIRDVRQSLDKTDCNQLINAHDYEHSKLLFENAKLESPRGPVLISMQRVGEYEDKPISDRLMVIWDLSLIDDADLPLTLLAWAQIQALSDVDFKKALAEPSFEDTVVKIAEIAASRVYRKSDIQITFISPEKSK